MTPYVIQQGDFLTLLAHRRGFDADAVWNHADNEALRTRRAHRDLLCPGDVVQLPDAPTTATLSVQPGQTNSFSARVPTVHLRVVLRVGAAPAANVAYTLTGLPRAVSGTTSSDGAVEFDAPLGVAQVELHLPARKEIYPLRIGDLDPVNEPSGLRARLHGLGYHAAQQQSVRDRGRSLQRAVEDFQTDHGLTVTAEADDATLQALVSAFGC